MRRCRQLFSALLALLMVSGCLPPALAAEPSPGTAVSDSLPEEAEEAYEDEEDAGEEIVVFRLVGDEDDESLEMVTDDKLLDEVFAEFCNQCGDSEDADEAAALEPDEE